MTDEISYQSDPEYQLMMSSFQKGDWKLGLTYINNLILKYPLEPELRTLRQEMYLRSQIDDYEAQEHKKTRLSKVMGGGLRIILALVIVAVFFFVLNRYAGWLRGQMASAQTQVEADYQQYARQQKIDAVNSYLSTFRAAEAKALIEEIRAEDPNVEDLDTLTEQANQIEGLNTSYSEAMILKSQGDVKGALDILQGMPSYRDVALQIRELQLAYDMNDMLAAGDEAVLAGDWEEAVARYEELRNRDLLFERQEVEARLYNSYMNAAKTALENQPDSLDALKRARDYFSKALTIRPQDEKVIEEMEIARQTVIDRLFNGYLQMAQQSLLAKPDSLEALTEAEKYLALAQEVKPGDATVDFQMKAARAFVQAVKEFANNKYDNVTKLLEPIYEKDPDYANGTARQMLYDTYISRGDDFLFNGRPQSSIGDFQKAIAIAELRPDSALRLFESQARMGDALGVMGNYETAVYQYRVALEEANILDTIVLDPKLDALLTQADSNAQRSRFRNAYNLYRQVMKEIVNNFQTVTVVVTSGDYLAQLANYYQTTVNAILAASDKSDPSNISIGDKIVIPVLP